MDFVGVASPYVGRRYKRRLIVDEEKVTDRFYACFQPFSLVIIIF